MNQTLVLALTLTLTLVTASASAKIDGGGTNAKAQPVKTATAGEDIYDDADDKPQPKIRRAVPRPRFMPMKPAPKSAPPLRRYKRPSSPSWDEFLDAKESAAYRKGRQQEMERSNDSLRSVIGILGITIGGILMGILIFLFSAMHMAKSLARQEEEG